LKHELTPKTVSDPVSPHWFIVANEAQGHGIGKALLAQALALEGAQAEFTRTEQRSGSQWGQEVLEQRFTRPKS
jgi:GNAT superfamily N-acetyltransferase